MIHSYIYIYTFSVWVISYCPMESLICKQTSLSPCATKAPSWPQMTLNVFWLEELEVRGRMLEYEDAKGRQCFFFWFAVLLVYSWSWWMYPLLQRRSKHWWGRRLEWYVWNLTDIVQHTEETTLRTFKRNRHFFYCIQRFWENVQLWRFGQMAWGQDPKVLSDAAKMARGLSKRAWGLRTRCWSIS